MIGRKTYKLVREGKLFTNVEFPLFLSISLRSFHRMLEGNWKLLFFLILNK